MIFRLCRIENLEACYRTDVPNIKYISFIIYFLHAATVLIFNNGCQSSYQRTSQECLGLKGSTSLPCMRYETAAGFYDDIDSSIFLFLSNLIFQWYLHIIILQPILQQSFVNITSICVGSASARELLTLVSSRFVLLLETIQILTWNFSIDFVQLILLWTLILIVAPLFRFMQYN